MSIKQRTVIQSNVNALTAVGVSASSSSTSKNAVHQRLHPDWRMIPHHELFGWTEKHRLLEQYLMTQIKSGTISDIYFASEREYVQAELRLKNPNNKFVGPPIVNTVDGIFTILQRYEAEITSPPYCKENVLGR